MIFSFIHNCLTHTVTWQYLYALKDTKGFHFFSNAKKKTAKSNTVCTHLPYPALFPNHLWWWNVNFRNPNFKKKKKTNAIMVKVNNWCVILFKNSKVFVSDDNIALQNLFDSCCQRMSDNKTYVAEFPYLITLCHPCCDYLTHYHQYLLVKVKSIDIWMCSHRWWWGWQGTWGCLYWRPKTSHF